MRKHNMIALHNHYCRIPVFLGVTTTELSRDMRFILLVLLVGVAAYARSIDRRSILFYLETTADLAIDGSKSCGERPLDPDSEAPRDDFDQGVNDKQNYQLQQLLLTGFRNNKINSYNIRQPDGFNSNGGERQCIAVQYNITCGANAGEVCASMNNDSCKNADEWIFIWTVFNTRTTTGKLLLRITVYDLRVFGFELCDVYKQMITISINLTSQEDMPGNTCYDMCKALADFTTLLPGLSNEQPNANNGTPEAKGYGTYWYKVENIERHGGHTVTTFLILFILMFKVTFVFFSYELYQRLIKQKLYKKTHKRYYTYWSAHLLILGGLVGLGTFADKFQSNKVALKTFWGSVIVDCIIAMMVIVIVAIKANPLSDWKCLKGNEGDAENGTENDGSFIPPPLLGCCQCCKCQPSKRCERCSQSTKQILIVLANGGSLFLFLVIGSYVAQALPAIAMSYYVNPTATLIRFGFFELAVVVLLMELSYLIFLCDKLSWLCYVRTKGKLPDELSNEADFISVYVNECKNNDAPVQQDETEEGRIRLTNGDEAEGDRARLLNKEHNNYGAFERQPVNAAPGNNDPPGDNDPPGNNDPPGDDDPPGNNDPPGDDNPPGNNDPPGEDDPPGNNDPPGEDDPPGNNDPPGENDPPGNNDPPIDATTQQKEYSCHWCWLFVVFCQIITLLFVIAVSSPTLFFLMQIVIDQTSSSNTDFKDLLTIIPTIALNAWLLFKHGDIAHAMKEIMKSAIKEQRGHPVTTTPAHRVHE